MSESNGQNNLQEWKQMQNIWAQSDPAGPDVDGVLSYVLGRSQEFDRKVRLRNRVEWGGGIFGIVFLAVYLRIAETPVEFVFGLSMGFLVVAMCLHMRKSGAPGPEANPALSREQFRIELERKYARQIEFLGKATYWFLIPLLATAATTAWAYWSGVAEPKDALYAPLLLVGTGFAWFANRAAVTAARREWDQVRRALEDGRVTE